MEREMEVKLNGRLYRRDLIYMCVTYQRPMALPSDIPLYILLPFILASLHALCPQKLACLMEMHLVAGEARLTWNIQDVRELWAKIKPNRRKMGKNVQRLGERERERDYRKGKVSTHTYP